MRQLLISLVAATMLIGTAAAATIEMKVNGLVCAFCAQGIEKTLRKYPATADVIVSLEHRLVAIAMKEGQDIPDEQLRQALKDAGYDVKSIERTERTMDVIRNEVRSDKR